MAAKMSVLGLILSSYRYLRSGTVSLIVKFYQTRPKGIKKIKSQNMMGLTDSRRVISANSAKLHMCYYITNKCSKLISLLIVEIT